MNRQLKKVFCLLLCCLIVCSSAPGAFALWEPEADYTADAMILINLDHDKVIWAQNENEPHAIASLTKMMTALLVIESGEDLDTIVTVPEELESEFEHIRSENGAYIDLKIGEEVSLRDLLYCTLLPSTNDTASVLAWAIGGSIDAFVARMNERAQELGCANTHFSCPHGLYDADNYSTAADLAILAEAFLQNDTLMQVVTSTDYWLSLTNMHTSPQSADAPEGKYLQIRSTNRLQMSDSGLYRDYVRGIKTGFTDAAGRCLVTSASDNGENYLLVLLGTPNQRDENNNLLYFDYAADLFDWALERFETVTLPLDDAPIATVPVAFSEDGTEVGAIASDTLTDYFWDTQQEITYTTVLRNDLRAPVEAGDVLGTAELFAGEESLGTLTLVADRSLSFSRRLYMEAWLEEHRTLLITIGVALALLLLAFLLLILRARARRRRRRMRYYKRHSS